MGLVGMPTLALSQAPDSQSPVPPADPSPQQMTIIPAPPRPQPTPEQLGDALMAHQRYQAAIEAYKKAPQTIRRLEQARYRLPV